MADVGLTRMFGQTSAPRRFGSGRPAAPATASTFAPPSGLARLQALLPASSVGGGIREAPGSIDPGQGQTGLARLTTPTTATTTPTPTATPQPIGLERALSAQRPAPRTPFQAGGMSPEVAGVVGMTGAGLGAASGLAKLSSKLGMTGRDFGSGVAGGAQALGGLVGLGSAAYDLAEGGDPARFAFKGASAANSIAQGGAGAARALGAAGPALTPALNAISSYAPYVGAAINTGSDLYQVAEGNMDARQAAINASLDSGLAVGTVLSGPYAPITAVAGSFINPQIKKLAAEWFGPGMHDINESYEAKRTNDSARSGAANISQVDSPEDLMDTIRGLWNPGAESQVAASVHDKDGTLLGYLNGDHPGIPSLEFGDAYQAVVNGGYVNGQVLAGVRPEFLTPASEQLSRLLTSSVRLHGDAGRGVPEARSAVERARTTKRADMDRALGGVRTPEYGRAMTWETNPTADVLKALGPGYGSRTSGQVTGELYKDPVYARQSDLLREELGQTGLAAALQQYAGGRSIESLPHDQLEVIRNAARNQRATAAYGAGPPPDPGG